MAYTQRYLLPLDAHRRSALCGDGGSNLWRPAHGEAVVARRSVVFRIVDCESDRARQARVMGGLRVERHRVPENRREVAKLAKSAKSSDMEPQPLGVNAMPSLDALVSFLHSELDARGIDEMDKLDVLRIQAAMEAYCSNPDEWARFRHFDIGRYTRNLVDSGNGKFNLMILCWPPGIASPIHDHAGSHCLMKVIEGDLRESRYAWPAGATSEPLHTASSITDQSTMYSTKSSGKGAIMNVIKETDFSLDNVAYIHDKIGLHRISNATSKPSVSLHLYCPPYETCKTFDESTSKCRGSGRAVFFSEGGVLKYPKSVSCFDDACAQSDACGGVADPVHGQYPANLFAIRPMPPPPDTPPAAPTPAPLPPLRSARLVKSVGALRVAGAAASRLAPSDGASPLASPASPVCVTRKSAFDYGPNAPSRVLVRKAASVDSLSSSYASTSAAAGTSSQPSAHLAIEVSTSNTAHDLDSCPSPFQTAMFHHQTLSSGTLSALSPSGLAKRLNRFIRSKLRLKVFLYLAVGLMYILQVLGIFATFNLHCSNRSKWQNRLFTSDPVSHILARLQTAIAVLLHVVVAPALLYIHTRVSSSAPHSVPAAAALSPLDSLWAVIAVACVAAVVPTAVREQWDAGSLRVSARVAAVCAAAVLCCFVFAVRVFARRAVLAAALPAVGKHMPVRRSAAGSGGGSNNSIGNSSSGAGEQQASMQQRRRRSSGLSVAARMREGEENYIWIKRLGTSAQAHLGVVGAVGALWMVEFVDVVAPHPLSYSASVLQVSLVSVQVFLSCVLVCFGAFAGGDKFLPPVLQQIHILGHKGSGYRRVPNGKPDETASSPKSANFASPTSRDTPPSVATGENKDTDNHSRSICPSAVLAFVNGTDRGCVGVEDNLNYGEKQMTEWKFGQFLGEPATQPVPFALIILNQPVCAIAYLQKLWDRAAIKLCADGGANRLFDAFDHGIDDRDDKDAERGRFLPDMIIGDLDSLREDVRNYYEAKGVGIVKINDLYSTDFGKCLRHIEDVERSNAGIRYEVLAMGALGGRFDQTIASVFQLHALAKKDESDGKKPRKVYLFSNESVALLLLPGQIHRIFCDTNLEGPTCGLIPFSGRVHAVTKGLEWNIDETMPLSFETLVSTSNWFAAGPGRERVVEVSTDGPLMWTAELDLSNQKRNMSAADASAQYTPNTVHEDVVHPNEEHSATPSRIIAIAVDSSKYSEYAFDWAINNVVRPESDQIVIMNVRPIASLPTVYGALYVDFAKDFEKMDEANKKESHDLLRAYAGKLPANKYNIRGVALRGDPRDEIAYKVEDIKADMLIIGSRGLGAFKRAFLGSVSDYLVHQLKIPVIIPRPTEAEKVI
ncbi:Cysteine dioxygenase [Entophlyctis sp. JEL0112]|nr:Cysteine dioxygenase [Entophlyctis sp. JEL0112]